jgi:hypothetical protein
MNRKSGFVQKSLTIIDQAAQQNLYKILVVYAAQLHSRNPSDSINKAVDTSWLLSILLPPKLWPKMCKPDIYVSFFTIDNPVKEPYLFYSSGSEFLTSSSSGSGSNF